MDTLAVQLYISHYLGMFRTFTCERAPMARKRKAADKIGYSVFIPPLTLAVSAVLVATFLKVLGANNAIGISGAIALIVALLLFKTRPSYAVTDGTRSHQLR